jgi:hypothetical protein
LAVPYGELNSVVDWHLNPFLGLSTRLINNSP